MVENYQMTITATPIKIVQTATGVNLTHVYVTNQSSTNNVFVGGDSTVTSLTGYELGPDTGSSQAFRQEFTLPANEELYAVCAAGQTAVVTILVTEE